MSGLFFVQIFGMGVERGVSDAVGRIGCGVRRNWSQRQTKFGRKSHFLSASELREPDLELTVEHFFKFWRFCSTLEPARGGFGVGGRTFFQILENLFYFGARGRQNWTQE